MGTDEKVSVSWLILQRLDNLKDQISAVRPGLNQFQQETGHRFGAVGRRFGSIHHRFDAIDHRFEKTERLWIWTVGLIALMALGLLAKLLVLGV